VLCCCLSIDEVLDANNDRPVRLVLVPVTVAYKQEQERSKRKRRKELQDLKEVKEKAKRIKRFV
jgi:hypothetical protein